MRVHEVEVEPTIEPKGCRCGDVLRGIMAPSECPLFRKVCTPEKPRGTLHGELGGLLRRVFQVLLGLLSAPGGGGPVGMPARLPAASRPMRLAPVSRLGEIEKPSMPNRPLPPGARKPSSERGKRGAFLVRWTIEYSFRSLRLFGEANETSGILPFEDSFQCVKL